MVCGTCKYVKIITYYVQPCSQKRALYDFWPSYDGSLDGEFQFLWQS